MGRGSQILRRVLTLLVLLTTVTAAASYISPQVAETVEDDVISSYVAELIEEAVAKCPRVGDTISVEALEEAESCLISELDLPALERILETRDEQEQVAFDTAFRGLCDKRPALHRCVKPFSEAATNCTQNGNTFVTAIAKLAQSVCDSQARISAVMVGDKEDCYSERWDHFHGCVLKFLLPPPKTVGESCGILAKVQDCAIKSFSTCADPNFVPDLIYDTAKSMDCPVESMHRSGSVNAHRSFFDAWCIVPVLIFANNYFL